MFSSSGEAVKEQKKFVNSSLASASRLTVEYENVLRGWPLFAFKLPLDEWSGEWMMMG